MTHRVTIEEISRLMDGELHNDERRDIEQRLDACPASRRLKQSLERLMNVLPAAILQDMPPAETPASENCFSEALLMRIADGSVSPEEKNAVEAHMAECNRCLSHVVAHLRTAKRMEGGVWPSLPTTVSERKELRALIHTQEAKEEQGWETLNMPTGATTPLERTLRAQDLCVTLSLQPLPDGYAGLTISVKDRARSRIGQEATLTNRATHRKTFTGRTDARGVIEIHRLPPGIYELHLRGSLLKIALYIDE